MVKLLRRRRYVEVTRLRVFFCWEGALTLRFRYSFLTSENLISVASCLAKLNKTRAVSGDCPNCFLYFVQRSIVSFTRFTGGRTRSSVYEKTEISSNEKSTKHRKKVKLFQPVKLQQSRKWLTSYSFGCYVNTHVLFMLT